MGIAGRDAVEAGGCDVLRSDLAAGKEIPDLGQCMGMKCGHGVSLWQWLCEQRFKALVKDEPGFDTSFKTGP
jgi:hypothetical protein